MALSPSSSRRERILVMGMSNSGKSTTWLNIAEWIHRTRSPSRIFLLDTDSAWEAYRPLDGHLDDIVVVSDLYEFQNYLPALKDAVTKSDPARGDWLVVDMIDKAWSGAQEYYFESLSGKDFGAFFMEAAKAKTPIGGDYGINWQAINKLYADFIQPVHRWRGHVLCCTPASKLQEAPRSGRDMVAAEVRLQFGRIGYVPQGQKDLPHIFHTVLLTQETPKGWVINTVKDRERPRLQGVQVGSEQGKEPGFVVKYLMQVAGWKP